MTGYLFNILLALDLLGSAILAGKPGETLSGRAGVAQRNARPVFAYIVNAVMFNRNHCRDAIQGDIRRAQAVIADDSK